MRLIDLRRLSPQTQREIAEYIKDNPRREDGMHWDVSTTMNMKEALDIWLKWNGIINFTNGIWDFVRNSRDEAAEACLEEALAELEGMVDVVDSDDGYGRPQPNTAMRVSMLIEQALGRRPIG